MSYKGVKDFLSEFKEPYDYKKKAKEILRENGEKATKQAIEDQIIILKENFEKSCKRGNKLHDAILNRKTKTKDYIVEGWSESNNTGDPDPSTNLLKNNTNYLEKKIVSIKYKLIGYSDEVTVKNNFINIEDSKTTKKIYKTSSIRLKNGFVIPPSYYFAPIDNIQACNFFDAALQMSLYMYLLWVHNKKLKPGKLFIRHIKTNDKDDILEEELIEVPYLLEEVKKLLKHRIRNGC